MKGIGTEEFYGGPDSVDFKGKHYTSTVEKYLKELQKRTIQSLKLLRLTALVKFLLSRLHLKCYYHIKLIEKGVDLCILLRVLLIFLRQHNGSRETYRI